MCLIASFKALNDVFEDAGQHNALNPRCIDMLLTLCLTSSIEAVSL